MNYVDVKLTIWKRAEFSDDADMEKVIATLKDEGIEAMYDDDLGFKECSVLFETEEFVEPLEKGDATIEVYAGDELKWSNEINQEDKTSTV